MMDNWALEEQAKTALMEAVTRHTVIVDVSLALGKSNQWGTGSLLRIKNRLFIATCKHIVSPEYKTEGLRVLYRSTAPMKWTDKEDIKKSSLNVILSKIHKTFSKTIPVTGRFYSDDNGDLALLELDQSIEGQTEGGDFFTVEDVIAPKVGMGVYLMGFSVELTRKVTKHGDLGGFPYFENTRIVEAKTSLDKYDPQRHFLTDFEITDDSVDPHGLSGCAVWTRLPSGKNVWTPNLRLVGIQHGYYSKPQLLVATRIERLLKLVM